MSKVQTAKLTMQGEFEAGVNIKKMVDVGLIPSANYQINERYTKALTDRIVELVLQNYVAPRLLAPAPVSFFEPAREWQKEKAMKGAELSMDMMGKSIEQYDYESFSQILPGLTKAWGYSWRQLGIASRNGVPLVSNTERQAIKRMLIDANSLVLNGSTGGKVTGLLDVPTGSRIVSATAVWSDFTNSRPFDDLARSLEAIAALDYEVPGGWNVAIHPTNASEARRHLVNMNTTTVAPESEWARIQRELAGRFSFIETTAIPEGTVLGVPKGSEYGELLTTGLPTVVPTKADAMSVSYQARMIAVPVAYDATPFFKITGV